MHTKLYAQRELVSFFALTPIDRAAFAYQLADLKTVDRFATRLWDLELRNFRLSSFDVIRITRSPSRTKYLPVDPQVRRIRFLDRRNS
jgi:hypothetical protein